MFATFPPGTVIYRGFNKKRCDFMFEILPDGRPVVGNRKPKTPAIAAQSGGIPLAPIRLRRPSR